MFGKIQTTTLAAALCLAASSTWAGFSSNDVKLEKSTSDDLVCHTFAIEIQSAKKDGGFNFFPNVEQDCVKRILTHQPQLLRGATVRAHGNTNIKARYSYNH